MIIEVVNNNELIIDSYTMFRVSDSYCYKLQQTLCYIVEGIKKKHILHFDMDTLNVDGKI